MTFSKSNNNERASKQLIGRCHGYTFQICNQLLSHAINIAPIRAAAAAAAAGTSICSRHILNNERRLIALFISGQVEENETLLATLRPSNLLT